MSSSSSSSSTSSSQPRPHYSTAPANNSPPPQQTVRTSIRPDTTERRVLVIGKGISISGTITDAERVVIEGVLESKLVRANEISISPTGVFTGDADVEDAEVSGSAEGVITARGSLIVRAPGRVAGTVRCRRLQVEDGGQITGQVEMLTDASPTPAAAPAETVQPPESRLSESRLSESRHTDSRSSDTPSAMPIKPDLIS